MSHSIHDIGSVEENSTSQTGLVRSPHFLPIGSEFSNKAHFSDEELSPRSLPSRPILHGVLKEGNKADEDHPENNPFLES
jgi:hypothetical protein